MPAPLIGYALYAGGAALAAWLLEIQEGCGGEPEKVPPLPVKEQDTTEGKNDGAAKVDAGEVNSSGGDTSIETKVEKQDGGMDTVADTADDSYYNCNVVAVDKYGMRYAMLMASDSSGLFAFKAADGTDALIEDARLNEAASIWPKSGQKIPDFAGDLVAKYEVSKLENELTISNYTIGGGLSNVTLLPMTWATENDLPEPIDATTENEVYIAMEQSLKIAVGCNDGDECENGFEGSVDIGDMVWAGIDWLGLQSIEINCFKE